MFSCKIGEIFKNNYFEKHRPTDASINHGTIIVRIIVSCINERQQKTHA